MDESPMAQRDPVDDVNIPLHEAYACLLGDGNGHVRAQQQIPYTDFPMPEQNLYACWDSEHWVIMLPSEY